MLIPFHPGEGSQLFMSSDVDILLTNPSRLFWTPENDNDHKQTLRKLDAPITRYVLGIYRKIAGIPPLKSDWDWSKSWEENITIGAMPSKEQLWIGRLSITLLLPLTLFFLFKTTKTVTNAWGGLLAILFLGTNSIVLLHARRAMAEGALILGVSASIYSFIKANKYPWLAGISIALAFNAKQTAIALLPIGLLAAIWVHDANKKPQKVFSNAITYIATFLAMTFLLNPFLWSHPFQALNASVNARFALTQQQVREIQQIAPHKILNTPSNRIIAFIDHTFITPPSFFEIGNYTNNTSASQVVYLSNKFHTLWRGFIAGGIVLFFSLVGFITPLTTFNKLDRSKKRAFSILILSTLSQGALLLITIPLPWQRYYMPMIPFVAIWFAIGMFTFITKANTIFATIANRDK